MHTTEAGETANSAEGTAGYFMGGSGGRPASAHYCADIDSVVQCVREADTAYGAPGFNLTGIHVEQAGKAAQKKTDWADAYSIKMLRTQVAPLVADICRRRNIPPVKLTVTDLMEGKRAGIIGHADATLLAKKMGWHTSGHMDPGKDYPWDLLISQVKKLLK